MHTAMKAQFLLALFLFGTILVSAEEKKEDSKPVEQPEKKQDKRGLFDLGDHGGFESFGHGGGLELHGGFDDHHQKEHSTYDFKEIKVPIPAPYPVHIEKKVPAPYPVKVPVHIERPVPYPVIKPYPVHVEKPVPYPVTKHIPYPVKVPVKIPYPVKVPYHVEKPYPVTVIKKVPYAVKQPYVVEKEVPYIVKTHDHHESHDFGGHDFGGHDFGGHGLDLSHHHY